jgi:D-aspartate ligase
MGDVDLVRALSLAGIASACACSPDAPARYSRHVETMLPCISGVRDHEQVMASLLSYGRAQPEPPVLYPQTDAALLVTSRHRDELSAAFRFLLADAELVDQLVDKDRFQALAEHLGLPVPRAHRLSIGQGERPPALDVEFPIIVKPVTRAGDWTAVGNGGKALQVGGPREWAALWPRLASLRSDVVVQKLIPGPESALESYHAYVDDRGSIAGEFTGRKIRTFPVRYGFSTAVEIVELPDVAALGREVLASLGVRGVAKADFKRDDRGRLHLLEVNPRFNIWHHPAAVAGVNLPALVHSDVTGGPRPPVGRPIRRVTWCVPLTDLRAAYASGISPLRWMGWARGCEAVSGFSRDDPLPFVRGTLTSAVVRRLPLAKRDG